MKKCKLFHSHIEYIVLPIVTLLCFAGFIGSLFFPKQVLDTYKINVSEEDGDAEFGIPLSEQTPVSYELNTAGSPMRGIQVAVSKEGSSQEGVILRYQVYEHSADEARRFGELLSDNVYQVSDGDEVQYVYLPFEDSEKCRGDIIVTFCYESDTEIQNPPALLANHTLIDNTLTMNGEQPVEGSLKTMYIYTHDTYPLLYDFRLMTFVFLAASMAVSYSGRKRGKGDDT